MGSLSTANVEFCLDVFKELNSHSAGDNIFFSPLSLLYALSMILLGARTRSAEQMEKVLHFNHVVGPLKSDFQDSSKQYLNCSEKIYGARLQTVDFEHSPEEARQTINAWVESQTNGKVTDLFQRGTIDPSSIMVLVNAIYFKGQWQYKFQERETTKAPFELSEGKSVTVEMMYQSGIFKLAFIKEAQLQVLELPYVNNILSMLILLPVGTAKLEQIEEQLNLKTFQQWTSPSNLMEREVEVHIPRFKLEMTYEMNSLLKSLGMTDIFDQRKADLSGMSPAKTMHLSKVIHKSYVDVNEAGTEAAAATGDVIVVKRLPIRAQFLANRPFLFFIRHTHTNTILFCGKFASP
ncbi:serpin B11 isoform X2 [Echinops telfairi]|uniref:Serpin B11 isoform X2 n=1 Tax=Echinops telfairi TaxID=9371 RepID=A0AC55DKA8_ECHTE|nr:serpin B11 isoform X2 [Echinops telfairi]